MKKFLPVINTICVGYDCEADSINFTHLKISASLDEAKETIETYFRRCGGVAPLVSGIIKIHLRGISHLPLTVLGIFMGR